MIRIQNVVKRYTGMDRPAVSELSLHVKEGEICVMVGPSGCGKTTTLKMINRIIEPTEGEIYVNGKNILEQNPDKLRQHIGYVIQKTGLFPHYTVYENIAVVPRLLGWDEEKIKKRVDELLELVELDPEENRYKYPNALSGGQKQRVGVARAMAADPPVMLMDEPFGAVDPITRNQLQNEFLKLQKKVRKTICFVTHDIDEAIKMGDKIAIMNNGELVQYDTPENILFSPKNEFVEQFVGSDRSLKVLNLLKVDVVMKRKFKIISMNDEIDKLRDYFNNTDKERLIVVNKEGKLEGYMTRKDAAKTSSAKGWNSKVKSYPSVLPKQATLRDALSEMLIYDIGAVPITEDDGKLLGLVRIDDIRGYVGETYQENGNHENEVE